MKHIPILLADDHLVVREGLRVLLESEEDLRVIGEAGTGRAAVRMARDLRPAVVVMDIAMPGLSGLEATRLILKQAPWSRVLILSAHGEEGYLKQAASIGAAGFLLKQASAHVLSEAIRMIAKGNVCFPPASARSGDEPLGQVPDQGGAEPRRHAHLTSREVEVLQLIAGGRANKQIAAELGISVKTVEKHRQRLMDRLNLHETASLTRYAVAAGIIGSSVSTDGSPGPNGGEVIR